MFPIHHQLRLALVGAGAGGRHGAVTRSRRGGVAGETADARVLAHGRRRRPAVSHVMLAAQGQLQVVLAGARGRFLVHRQHVRQHGDSAGSGGSLQHH